MCQQCNTNFKSVMTLDFCLVYGDIDVTSVLVL